MARIAVVGGGPAGLLFAKLAKQADAGHEIDVFEQNPSGATYGFGVVLADVALDILAGVDPGLREAIAAVAEFQDRITIVHQGVEIPLRGNGFMGISRVKLLDAMQRNAEAAGARLHFETRISDPAALDGYDMIVGADGVNSAVRACLNDHFQATKEPRRNKWVWYATPKRLESVGLIFQATDHGIFIAHSYRFSPELGTFVIECSPETWHSAGLDAMSDEDSRAFCADVFRDYLDGYPLVSNRSGWFNPEFVTSRHWHHGNVVLIGDALKTVHPSIGSGTRVGMQDAIALAQALDACAGDVARTFETFERTRRTGAGEFQDAAMKSIVWYETVDERIGLDPVPFAYDYMMRTGRVSHERLRRIDPAFAALAEGHRVRGAA
ncbi:FAD-dependent monooxygenase [Sphingomonas bacterium]|uniref:FAD-dependent monooxygenase n=1 Tax=Sphingomonas bacterium TaxID=1895847 RepID=UPI0015773F23|nr:FAD-dependent monooxygenase [Sphingomonas bacterium]